MANETSSVKYERLINEINVMVDELISVNADGLIYHYTEADVIINILKEKKIWASSVYFLNDRQEANYSTDLFSKIIDKKYSIKSKEKKYYIETFLDRYIEIQEKSFVVSFSLDPDSIALWNNYGKNEGYALGFKIIDCIRMFSQKSNNLEHSTYFGKTIYDKKKQCKIIESLLDSIDISNKLALYNIDNSKKIKDINLNLINKLKAILMTNKGKAHQAENEYRVVIIPDKKWLKKIEFRNRYGIITPYIEIEFNSVPISELIIGPKISEKISEKGCDAMLKSYGYTHVDIVKSKLDVRF